MIWYNKDVRNELYWDGQEPQPVIGRGLRKG